MGEPSQSSLGTCAAQLAAVRCPPSRYHEGKSNMLVTEGERFVAFFDLLGFGSWVESAGSKEVFKYVRGFWNLVLRASLPGSVVRSDMSVDVHESDVGYINFSGSVVFYSRDDS